MLLHILAVQNFFSTSIVEVCSRQAALWFPWHGFQWIMQLYTGWVTGGIASGKTLCPASWRLLWRHLNRTDSITTHPRAVLNLTPLDSVHLLASQQILSYPWVRQQDIMSVPNKFAIAWVPVVPTEHPSPHTRFKSHSLTLSDSVRRVMFSQMALEPIVMLTEARNTWFHH